MSETHNESVSSEQRETKPEPTAPKPGSKKTVLTLVAVAVLLIAAGTSVYVSTAKASQKRTVSQATKAVDDLFISTEGTTTVKPDSQLASEVTTQTISTAQTKVEKVSTTLTKQTLTKRVVIAKRMYADQLSATATVNKLFVGSTVKDDLTSQETSTAAAAVEKVTNPAKNKELSARVTIATAELTNQSAASKALAELKALGTGVTDEAIANAKTLTDKVTNKKAKNTCDALLAEVTAVKTAYDQQVASTAVAEEQQAKSSPSGSSRSGSSSSSSGSGSSNSSGGSSSGGGGSSGSGGSSSGGYEYYCSCGKTFASEAEAEAHVQGMQQKYLNFEITLEEAQRHLSYGVRPK